MAESRSAESHTSVSGRQVLKSDARPILMPDSDTKTLESKKIGAGKLKHMRDKDRELVKGIFKFYEVPGGTLSFVFRKYKQDPVERFDLQDGDVYTIPLGVAKHLNTNGWYPVHHYMQDAQGKAHMRINQKKRRFGFQSLEFVDIEGYSDAQGEIVTVEHIG